MIKAPCWREERREAAVTTARMVACTANMAASVWRKNNDEPDPARPIRSSARRISGAKMTGIAINIVGRAVLINQEKAGRSTRLVRRLSKITNKITPRRITIAWVSRTSMRIV